MARIEPINPKDAIRVSSERFVRGCSSSIRKGSQYFQDNGRFFRCYIWISAITWCIGWRSLIWIFSRVNVLWVSEISGCNYCLGAHTAIGKGVGLSEEETISSRKGISADYKTQAGLEFVRKIIPNQGWVSDHDYNLIKQAGCSSEEVI